MGMRRGIVQNAWFFFKKKGPISGKRVITDFPFLLNAGCSRLFPS